MQLSRFAIPTLLIAFALAAPTAARDKEPSVAPAQIRELYACRDIGDAAQRLACFDREVGELAAADAAREITFTDRETARKARRGLFGFSFPKLGGIFGGDEDEIKEIETTIRAVSMNRSGLYTLIMEDDAVWTQIDTTRLPRQPKPGQKVKIKTATMGSYFATIDGGRTIRMKRDR
ncbi:hypothetical protein [Sphingopyxis alaskensis]|jgi:hypothetical protein|uniref:Uncharacterized protein n=1 Tax=Sphingopyxis alaskensis (strain DSM 13593 / LMG 18877 / RB2256) TaxID=317655 RepID=Q1GWS8_SPHAL|nr:hypothetical protein [Sphingopyxis alaskensis]ABF51894.1 conserved hypothetical protein [Sphingopyxis alaskensis RB2256]MCM3420288.1 hypothetical protein [Sphingopyxis alaskensis]